MDEMMQKIPENRDAVIGDMNEHVGSETVHKGYGL